MAKSAKPATKSEVLKQLADATQLSRKQVASVFETLGTTIKSHLGKKGPGVFVIPGLLKITVVHKPATKARPGKNPFTGEAITIKAKPARNSVKVRPLKSLKEMVK